MTHTDQPARRQPPPPPIGDPSDSLPEGAFDEPAAPPRKRHADRRGVSPAVARQIDENLKRLYREQVEQALPPALEALVTRLREGEATPDLNGKGGK